MKLSQRAPSMSPPHDPKDHWKLKLSAIPRSEYTLKLMIMVDAHEYDNWYADLTGGAKRLEYRHYLIDEDRSSNKKRHKDIYEFKAFRMREIRKREYKASVNL